jgi:uracil-DNA glycosylase family 4
MNKQFEIEKLKRKMQADRSLPFRKTATQIVFGEGSLNPKLYVLGEAPGRTEDETGRPFVGRSGQLLRRLIKEAGFKEDEVYITSVVRYRPPENKTPTPKQVAAYEKYVNQELAIIQPRIIMTVGGVSLKKFTKQPITKIHAKPIKTEWLGHRFVLIPMFHPAAALRNPEILKILGRDFKKLKKVLK